MSSDYFVSTYEADLFFGRYQDPANKSESTWEQLFDRMLGAALSVVPDPVERFDLTCDLTDALGQGWLLPSSPQQWNYGALGRRFNRNGSSCFTGRMGDALGDFRDADADAEDVYVASGGFGLLLDTVRPRGCKIKHCSEGAMGSMCDGGPAKRIEGTTGYITGSGRARGALMLQLGVQHPDALEFVVSKRPLALDWLDDWPANALAQAPGLDAFVYKFSSCYVHEKEWPSVGQVSDEVGAGLLGQALEAGVVKTVRGQVVPQVREHSGQLREANRDWDLPLQNCNMSVRCSDEFMHAVLNDLPWVFHWHSKETVTDGLPWTKTDMLSGVLSEHDVAVVVDEASGQVSALEDGTGSPKYGVVIGTWEGLRANLSPNRNQWRDTRYSRFFRRILSPILDAHSGRIMARQVWAIICENAWNHGDPGVVFSSTYERFQPVSTEVYGPRLSNPCCLDGDTYVDTDEGRIKIADLADRCARGDFLPNAFCWDRENNLPSVRPITHAWKSGEVDEVYEIETDKGVTIRATGWHPFLLKTMEYVKAEDLAVGMRLRKIHRHVHRDGYVYLESRVKTHKEHRFVWEEISGENADGFDIHHDNDDVRDNRYGNLVKKARPIHLSDHASGKGNGRFIEVSDERLADVYASVRERNGASTGRPGRRVAAPVTVRTWNDWIDEHGLHGEIPRAASKDGGRIQGMEWDEFCDRMEEKLRDLADGANHKIVRITRVPGHRDVYNITVRDHHNFGVSSDPDRTTDSVIVKNSEYVNSAGGSCNLISQNLRLSAEVALRTGGWVGDQDSWQDDGFSTRTHWTEIRDNPLFQAYLLEVREKAQLSTRYITAALEYNEAPVPYINEMTRDHYRTVGNGIMGLAEALILYHVRYGSDCAQSFAATTMSEVALSCWETSFQLAAEGWKKPLGWNQERMESIFSMRADLAVNYGLPETHVRRWRSLVDRVARGEWATHTAVTSVAPTGSIAQEAGWLQTRARWAATGVRKGTVTVTSGVEPTFSWGVHRQDSSGVDEIYHDLWFTDEHHGKPWMVTAMDGVTPEEHVRMQAAVAAFTCMSVSKTVNLPVEATVDDVSRGYMLAWQLGVPGTALYRDQSKPVQVLSALECPSGECKVKLPTVVEVTSTGTESTLTPISRAVIEDVRRAEGETDAWLAAQRRRETDEHFAKHNQDTEVPGSSAAAK